MNGWISKWVKSNYLTAKSDLCTCFFERGQVLADPIGYISMITASSWMFISSFEKFRKGLLTHGSICSMIQQSTHGYAGVTVPTTMFVYACNRLGVIGSYIRLEDFDRPQWQEPRALEALANPDCGWFYRADANSFEAIPGRPIAYWISNGLAHAFIAFPPLRDTAKPTAGIRTGNNERFLRYTWEVSINRCNFNSPDRQQAALSKAKWFPCHKGGGFRKWYGNYEYLINWEDDGRELSAYAGCDNAGVRYFFRSGLSWGTISSANLSVRYSYPGMISEHCGSMCFASSNEDVLCCAALLNSSVSDKIHEILSPTLSFREASIGNTPLCFGSRREQIALLSNQCVSIAKQDWDLFENSWDFKHHPLI